MTSATLSNCVFVSDEYRAQQQRIDSKNDRWPKTYELMFDVQESPAPNRQNRTDLQGSNLTFTTPACSRLKRAAERSGETYAGHIIRQRIRYSSCRSVIATEKNIWDWPWSNGNPRGDVPPTLEGVYGAWQLRCSKQGDDRRCALVQRSQPDNPDATEIITHFTMAWVRGRILPVWRVWVPRLQENWFRGMTPGGQKKWEQMLSACMRNPAGFTNCINGARARFAELRTKEVWFSLTTERRNLIFTKCIDAGCMVETSLEMSAKASAEFVRRHAISIKLHPLGNMPVNFQVRPDGFHQALDALSNIDQTDISIQAGGKRKAL